LRLGVFARDYLLIQDGSRKAAKTNRKIRGCELQLIAFVVECHSRTVEIKKKDCSVKPHPQPFSQWEKGERLKSVTDQD
jgi:hypothetical protein